MWSHCRATFSNCILNSSIWLSIALGLLPYGYCRRRKMFVQSNFALAYSVIMDAVMISLALHLWYKEQRFNFKRIWDWSVMDLLTQALYAVNIYGMLAVLWTNVSEYKYVLEIFKKLSALEHSYFGKYQHLSTKCVKFHNYIIWKGLALIMNNLLYFTHVFTLLGRYQVLSVRVVFVQLYRMLLNTILLLLALHFYRHVLLTYRYMRTLMEHLKYLANYGMPNAQAYTRWHEINEIVRVYMRLQQLSREFSGIYGKQVFFGIVALTLDNAQNTIILLLIWKSQSIIWYFTFIIYVIVINCIDFWLIIIACELAVNATRDLSWVLRCFNDTTQLDVETERELQLLALNYASNQPKFRVCGFVDLNFSTGLEISIIFILLLTYMMQKYYRGFQIFKN